MNKDQVTGAVTDIVIEGIINLFKDVAIHPEQLHRLNMPNIPTKTMGGKVCWNQIAESNGYRLQQNMITKHLRILDPNNVRIAWGGKKAMKELLQNIK